MQSPRGVGGQPSARWSRARQGASPKSAGCSSFDVTRRPGTMETAPVASAVAARLSGQQSFTFENLTDLFEARLDLASRKSDLLQSRDVGKLFTALFQKDDRAVEPDAALKESNVVHDV